MIVGVIAMLAFACGALLMMDDLSREIDLQILKNVKEMLMQRKDTLTLAQQRRLELAEAAIAQREKEKANKMEKWENKKAEDPKYADDLKKKVISLFKLYQERRADGNKDPNREIGIVEEILKHLNALGETADPAFQTRVKQAMDPEKTEADRDKILEELIHELRCAAIKEQVISLFEQYEEKIDDKKFKKILEHLQTLGEIGKPGAGTAFKESVEQAMDPTKDKTEQVDIVRRLINELKSQAAP
jgi:hypothetical protein